MKRIIAFVLTMLLILTSFSVSGFAEGSIIDPSAEPVEETQPTVEETGSDPEPEEEPAEEPKQETLADQLHPDLYYVSPKTALTSKSLADVAATELQDATENGSVGGSKYTRWFFEAQEQKPIESIRLSEPIDFGTLSDFNQATSRWDAIFVSWCANEADLISSAKFPKAETGKELFNFLHGNSLYETHKKNDLFSSDLEENTFLPEPDDLVFFPAGEDFRVGIVIGSEDSTLQFVIGGIGDAVRSFDMKFMDFPENAYIVRWHSEFDYLVPYVAFMNDEIGIKPSAAIGILANMFSESGLNVHSLGDEGTSYGICQWHNGRWLQMVGICNTDGYDWKTMEGQLHYFKYEMEHYFAFLLPLLNEVSDDAQGAYDAAYMFCVEFEIPAYKEYCGKTRGEKASTWLYPNFFGEK